MCKFKHLPKCTEEYKQQQIQQVLEADVIYAWECDLVPSLRWVQPTGGVLMIAIFALLFGDSWGWYLAFAMMALIMGSASYFLYQCTERQTGQLTQNGIMISTVEVVPEVCLLAVIFVGPLAFVGAGAGALMAFKMTGFNHSPKVEVFPFLNGLRYMIREEFEESMYEGGIGLVTLKNMDIMPDFLADENAPDPYHPLRNFHCILYYFDAIQQQEIRPYLDEIMEIESARDFLQARRDQNKSN
ncbi:hypothetical protein KDD30_23945 (plasmid) [Photobacterium sp. GJ3]|uniref:hypothetical protein n=1 Tax=Photobacterium sp. GJ3 TaxID=2829502 RepID=UPI001B8D5299|nr:hypothetical protein [Photobacterium sp. GJ3]QUJ69771.1 hypothetical protein KDD30_23945 [Photobacterium sp. GJ3]